MARQRGPRAKRDALDDMRADGETVMPRKSIPTFTDALRDHELSDKAIQGTCDECEKITMVAFRAWFRRVRPRCNACGGALAPSLAAQREYPQLRTQIGVADERKAGKPRRTPLTHCYHCGKSGNLGNWRCYTCKRDFMRRFRYLIKQYATWEDKREIKFPEMAGPFKRAGLTGLIRAMENRPIQEILDEDDQVIGYVCGAHKPDANLVLHLDIHGVIARGARGYILTDLGMKLLVVYRAVNPNRRR